MADDAVNALIPVAAVVHIALGVMALMLVRRTADREWNEIYAGYVISWMMIVLGLQYTFATLLDLKIDNFTDQDVLNGAYTNLFSSSYKYSEQALNSIFIALSFILPLIYPYPLLQKDNAIKVTTFLVVVICILIIPLDIFSDFSNRDMKGSINWICYIIWIPIYLRFLVGEMLYMEENARTVSSVALLLILSFKVQWMIFWLQNFIGIGKVYVARWLVEDELIGIASQSEISSSIFYPIGMSLSSVTFLILLAGELWRAYHKGISGLTISILVLSVVGIIWFLSTLIVMDTAESCVESVCQTWNSTFVDWYAFTYQVSIYLIVPLIFMFIILNYNMVDTESQFSKVVTRIMVLLLLLVATSSIIEMIQIVLPIPEMVTSALFAAGVVLFIGWEEKIMKKMMSGSESAVESIKTMLPINDLKLDDKQFQIFSITVMCLVIYGLLLAVLFDSMGLNSR